MRRALLYARTLRRLRWEQVVYRPLRRLQRGLPVRPGPAGEPDAPRMAALAAALAAWGPGDAAARLARADEVAAGRFTFVGHSEVMAEPEWTRRRVSHLWSYHLHYFGYGVDLA
ncbi:MAG: heparinase, partial [Longimicrobiaceae bacterium]